MSRSARGSGSGAAARAIRAVGISSLTCWKAHRLNGGSCQFASVTSDCSGNGGTPAISAGVSDGGWDDPATASAPQTGILRTVISPQVGTQAPGADVTGRGWGWTRVIAGADGTSPGWGQAKVIARTDGTGPGWGGSG